MPLEASGADVGLRREPARVKLRHPEDAVVSVLGSTLSTLCRADGFQLEQAAIGMPGAAVCGIAVHDATWAARRNQHPPS